MLTHGLARLRQFAQRRVDTVRARVSQWTEPFPITLITGLAADAVRGRRDLPLEHTLPRQQGIILGRTARRPTCTSLDRGLVVLLAGWLRTWASTLLIIQPETVLRWRRQGFRLFWRTKSAPRARRSPLATETIDLIQHMATENCLWGAERIRGELLTLAIRVSKRTIQKYMRRAQPARPSGQTWATFLQNHAHDVWACDFLQVTDLLFRPLFAFFIVELGSRRVVHVGVTRHPTEAWVTQQLREATPYDERPRFLIRDNDGKYGSGFDRLAAMTGIKVLRTPVHAPRAQAVVERFLGSVRRECLDRVLILTDAHLGRVLREYVCYFNGARPHQGLGQGVPLPSTAPRVPAGAGGTITASPVLGGVHHAYRRAA